jgi:hypothetical protein
LLPLSCVWADCDGRILRPVGGCCDDIDCGRFAMDPQVTFHYAGVRVRSVKVAG